MANSFGSNLTDLQSGMNAATAIDVQRANAQDQVNAQRLAEFTRARIANQQTQAQKATEQARLADLVQARAQAEKLAVMQDASATGRAQLDANTRIKIAEMNAQAQKDVARAEMEWRKTQAQANPMYGLPASAYGAFKDMQIRNQDMTQAADYSSKMSAARVAALKGLDEIKRQKEASHWWNSNAKPDPEIEARLKTVIDNLDQEALQRGLAPSPDGGYILPTLPGAATQSAAVPGSTVPNGTPAIPGMLAVPPQQVTKQAPLSGIPGVAGMIPSWLEKMYLGQAATPMVNYPGMAQPGGGPAQNSDPYRPQPNTGNPADYTTPLNQNRFRVGPDGRVYPIQ